MIALIMLVAQAGPTNFGIRTAPGEAALITDNRPAATAPAAAPGGFDIGSVSSLGARWGIVTSTYRTPEHNRRVGGVRNSYHLRGRAIDIARRPGVRHSQIESAYRSAGYHLVESLDEGDHSHFAFRTSPTVAGGATVSSPSSFKVIYAPGANR